MMGKLTKAQERTLKNDPDARRLRFTVDADTNCWEWQGSRNSKGYGQMAFRGRTWKAHRVSYTLFCGEIPDGLLVCHHCDNPCCVNPAHLFLGHATTNMQDMARKGRNPTMINSEQSHFRSGSAPAGDKASGHKITEDTALAIMDQAVAGVLTSDLARKYSLDRSSIQRLLNGMTWKHLKRPPGLPRPTGVYDRNAGREALSKAKEGKE